MINIVIDDLQKVNAGIINGLTDNIINAINAIKYHNKIPIKYECTICHVDIMILHHIKSYKAQRKNNNDESLFDGYIGEIWICPNCHQRIHIDNPYFYKTNLQKYYEYTNSK